LSYSELIVCGDSFTYGSELVPTDLTLDIDEYRVQRIWPTHLGKKLGVKNVINLARPAVSNKWIYSTTIGWLLENYISKQKSTDSILLLIGWTNITRKEFFFNQGKPTEKALHVYGDFDREPEHIQNFFKYYLLSIDYMTEGVYDFINYNYELVHFCQRHGIQYRCFNALPEEHHVSINQKYLKDLNVSSHIESFKKVETFWGRNIYEECRIKWEMTPDTVFLRKNEQINSFSNYIRILPIKYRLVGVHPSPDAHELWGKFLCNWITRQENDFHKSQKLL
jgi:hypothetical protein